MKPCPQGRTDYDECFAPFRYCPVKGCGHTEGDTTPTMRDSEEGNAVPECKVCGAVDPKKVYDHDGGAHDDAAVNNYDQEQAIAERNGAADSTPTRRCAGRPDAAPPREVLIDLCERGSAPENTWRNRDSAGAVRQLGECLALLRAGCAFTLAGSPQSNKKTWWVEITYKGFGVFDAGDEYDVDTFYIPTDARLREANGRDWY